MASLASVSSRPGVPSHRPTTLADLRQGDRARIEALSCEPGLRRRLLELGVVPGTRLSVFRGPEVDGAILITRPHSTLCLRSVDAAQIAVSKTADAP